MKKHASPPLLSPKETNGAKIRTALAGTTQCPQPGRPPSTRSAGAAGTGRPSLPARTPRWPRCPGEPGGARGAREDGGAAPAASRGAALPHTPPPPAPEAAAGKPVQRGTRRPGPGKVTHWGSAAARGVHGARGAAAPAARCTGAGSRPGAAPPPGTAAAAAAAADFLARSKLWPRLHFSTAPACLPGGERRAEEAQPDTQRGQWAAAEGGTERARGGAGQWRSARGGPEGRLACASAALPHPLGAVPAARLMAETPGKCPPPERRAAAGRARQLSRERTSGEAGARGGTGGAGEQTCRCAEPEDSWG